MRPSLISSALEICINARRPAMLWGPPGVGKSQVMEQLTKKLKFELIDVRAILFDPVDLRGIPHIQEGRTVWAIPDFLPNVEIHGEKGILFIDELNAAAPSVQAAFYQLILDRKLGDYKLPEGWHVFAAGNRETDRAVVNKMPTALANRFVHIDFEVHLEDWMVWAVNADIAPEVTSFINFRKDLLHDFNKAQHAFATPRTWEYTSDLLPELVPDIEFDLLKGTVGEGPAIEFLAFLKVWRDLPALASIIMNPKSTPVSENASIRYAVTGFLANSSTAENFEAILKYVDRLQPEYQVLFMREVGIRDKSLHETEAFITWAAANATVLM